MKKKPLIKQVDGDGTIAPNYFGMAQMFADTLTQTGLKKKYYENEECSVLVIAHDKFNRAIFKEFLEAGAVVIQLPSRRTNRDYRGVFVSYSYGSYLFFLNPVTLQPITNTWYFIEQSPYITSKAARIDSDYFYGTYKNTTFPSKDHGAGVIELISEEWFENVSRGINTSGWVSGKISEKVYPHLCASGKKMTLVDAGRWGQENLAVLLPKIKKTNIAFTNSILSRLNIYDWYTKESSINEILCGGFTARINAYSSTRSSSDINGYLGLPHYMYYESVTDNTRFGGYERRKFTYIENSSNPYGYSAVTAEAWGTTRISLATIGAGEKPINLRHRTIVDPSPAPGTTPGNIEQLLVTLSVLEIGAGFSTFPDFWGDSIEYLKYEHDNDLSHYNLTNVWYDGVFYNRGTYGFWLVTDRLWKASEGKESGAENVGPMWKNTVAIVEYRKNQEGNFVFYKVKKINEITQPLFTIEAIGVTQITGSEKKADVVFAMTCGIENVIKSMDTNSERICTVRRSDLTPADEPQSIGTVATTYRRWKEYEIQNEFKEILEIYDNDYNLIYSKEITVESFGKELFNPSWVGSIVRGGDGIGGDGTGNQYAYAQACVYGNYVPRNNAGRSLYFQVVSHSTGFSFLQFTKKIKTPPTPTQSERTFYFVSNAGVVVDTFIVPEENFYDSEGVKIPGTPNGERTSTTLVDDGLVLLIISFYMNDNKFTITKFTRTKTEPTDETITYFNGGTYYFVQGATTTQALKVGVLEIMGPVKDASCPSFWTDGAESFLTQLSALDSYTTKHTIFSDARSYLSKSGLMSKPNYLQMATVFK